MELHGALGTLILSFQGSVIFSFYYGSTLLDLIDKLLVAIVIVNSVELRSPHFSSCMGQLLLHFEVFLSYALHLVASIVYLIHFV
jgi:hypothetical protein